MSDAVLLPAREFPAVPTEVEALLTVLHRYLTHQLLGEEYPAVWAPLATSEDPDWEWSSAAQDSPDELLGLWLAAVARSEAAVERALTDDGLDQAVAVGDEEPRHTLRRVLLDLVEEYARHTGQADLIRESVDCLVGEDAPR